MKSYGTFGLYSRLPLKQCLAVESVSLLHKHCLFVTNVRWRHTRTPTTNAGPISSRATSAKFTWGKRIWKQIYKGHSYWDGKYCFFHATPKPKIEIEGPLTKLYSGSWQLTVAACFPLSCKWTRLAAYFKSLNLPETYAAFTVCRSEVDEQHISVEICSVKIMQMRSLSSLRTFRGVRADNTFLGGKKLPLTWSSVGLLAGQEEQQAREPRGWLQAAVPELGGALAWRVLGGTPTALLHCCAAALWEGAPGASQKEEEEVLGRLCQGTGGAFCILYCCTELRCLIR